MSVSNTEIQMACRTRALTLTVATTGLTSLGATSTGYSRSSGSFLTDGFAPGMEVVGVGFSAANNAAHVITHVTTGFLTVTPAPDVQGSTGSRSLSVGLPSDHAWENVKFTPTTGKPFVEEQYIPGPSTKIGLSRTSDLELTPMYQLQIHVPENTDALANGRYADAIQNHFSPLTAFTTASGVVVQVRSDVGSFLGQRQPSRTGFSVIPVTVPLRVRVANAVAA